MLEVALVVKKLPANAEVRVHVWALGWEDPLEEGMEYSLQYTCLENSLDRVAIGFHRVGHDWSDLAHTHMLFFK